MSLKPGQIKCIETLDRPIVVAAGAGSGKTFTLTKRVVHAIQSGFVDGIERVCAITFTNKAAAELKSRVKSELRACGLTADALGVDDAWISTIHGMCARILRAHAVELGIDPAFEVAEGSELQELRRAAVDSVLAAARVAAGGEGPLARDGDAAQRLDALFAEYRASSGGAGGTSVESMLYDLMDALSAHPSGAADLAMPPEVNAEPLFMAAIDAYATLLDAAQSEKASASRDDWIANAEEALEAARASFATLRNGDAMGMLALLGPFSFSRRFGSKEFKALVDETSTTVSCIIMELRLAAAAPHLSTLVLLAREALQLFAQMKRELGVLDNGDLLVMASHAIENHPDIAECYADRFQLVMVDEFQDTDQMQVDMIKRISGPGACRLCTVGDAQQSIYRFRGADVSVYRRHLESVRANSPDDIIMLPDNFRSHADVLALVDRVFEQPDMFGGSFMSLSPGRDEARVKHPFAEGERRILVQLTTKPSRGVSSDRVRSVAAERLADEFARLCEEGRSPGEMALLLGRMTYADIYAQAFRDRGLACVISGGSVFASTLEAKTVLELARVAANPADTEAACNVLAGPMFALTADDLLELATAALSADGDTAANGGAVGDAGGGTGGDAGGGRGGFRKRALDSGLAAAYRSLREDASAFDAMPALQCAVRVMGQFRSGVGRSTVSRLVMRAVLDSGWIARLQERGAEGLAQVGNVYKAIRMLEDIEADKAAGPASVSRRFEAVLDASKEAPGALSASGGGFVRIMTVHASKGLEFPIVAVADMHEVKGNSSKLLVKEIGGRVYASLDLGSSATAIGGAVDMGSAAATYASVVGEDADEDELVRIAQRAVSPLELRSALFQYDLIGDEEEAKRLLYVALTRAKEALVISMQGTRTRSNENGTPANCFSAVASALRGGDAGFDAGFATYDFGGSLPAAVEHEALEPSGADAGAGADVDADADDAAERRDRQNGEAPRSAGDAPGANAAGFMVPAEEKPTPVLRSRYAPAHEGVFSYSSVAEASHETDLPARLAARFLLSADDPSADEAPFGLPLDGAQSGGSPFAEPIAYPHRYETRSASVDDEDGGWAYIGADSSDADKSTDLGTAFHRLAQYAVIARAGEGPLPMPAPGRIDALGRSCGLGVGQRMRLADALDRWFASDVASQMAGCADLSAEVPFFIPIPRPGASPAFLEGEIDLLGKDGDGRAAHVVDYKTGGHAEESAQELAEKHVLQASCYAYVLLMQGIETVDATFVRVERARAGGCNQPQCVRYRFGAGDVEYLREAIAEAYGRASGS